MLETGLGGAPTRNGVRDEWRLIEPAKPTTAVWQP